MAGIVLNDDAPGKSGRHGGDERVHANLGHTAFDMAQPNDNPVLGRQLLARCVGVAPMPEKPLPQPIVQLLYRSPPYRLSIKTPGRPAEGSSAPCCARTRTPVSAAWRLTQAHASRTIAATSSGCSISSLRFAPPYTFHLDLLVRPRGGNTSSRQG